jgi:hypothetical protein
VIDRRSIRRHDPSTFFKEGYMSRSKADIRQVEFFGKRGYISQDGQFWVMTGTLEYMQRVEPSPASGEVQTIIDLSEASGRNVMIKAVVVPAIIGVRLYLEGVITDKMIKRGDKGQYRITLICPAFTRGTSKRPRLIISSATDKIACVDQDGTFIHLQPGI